VGNDVEHYTFKVVASHSDSPSFKVKENSTIEVKGKYTKLNTEGYGGMLCATWFDRPLSVAGRAVIKDGEDYRVKLVDFERDLVLIPSLAIHMNREANEGYAYNKQVDMLPLLSCGDAGAVDLKQMVAQGLGVGAGDIYGMDLYLYNRMAPSIWGANNEFISSGRLDDLQCAWTSLQGFLTGQDDSAVNVYACFDNEEVGSGTKQGAASTFLYDVLSRINDALGKSGEEFYCALASGFMLSCDNAHAVHPNFPDKTDVKNCVYMNEGIVIKSHAGQRYTSDAVSIAIFRGICEKAGVPVQFFANRSDMAGGSTLGNIAMSQVSMNCVDIGLPQLAMHSAYETAGVKDSYYMETAVKAFFDSSIGEKDADTLYCS
jgi:aspartyl aminopeptidase